MENVLELLGMAPSFFNYLFVLYSEVEHNGCQLFRDIPSGKNYGFKVCSPLHTWKNTNSIPLKSFLVILVEILMNAWLMCLT